MMRDELKSSVERGSRRREEADSLRWRRLRFLTSAATVRFGDRRVSDPFLVNAWPAEAIAKLSRSAPVPGRSKPKRSEIFEKAADRSSAERCCGRGRPHSGTIATALTVRRGFTLIELLVVIAIIAALAAMIAGLGRVAYRARVENRARAELNMLVGAIEAYHKKFGFYPPDNAIQNDSTLPPLYYELVGWTGTKEELQGVTNAFGVGGFVNSDGDRKNFLPNLKPKGHTAIPGKNPPTHVLTFPAVGPGSAGEFNTWNYRSTKPTNNTESFDIWLSVILGSKTNVISNWKE